MKPPINCKHLSGSLPRGLILKLQLHLESENQRVFYVIDSSLKLWQFPNSENNVSVRGIRTSQKYSNWQEGRGNPSVSLFPHCSRKKHKICTTAKSYFTRLGKTLTTGGNFMQAGALSTSTLLFFCSTMLSSRDSMVLWKRKRLVNLSPTVCY